ANFPLGMNGYRGHVYDHPYAMSPTSNRFFTAWLFANVLPSRKMLFATARLSSDTKKCRLCWLYTRSIDAVVRGAALSPPGRISEVPKSSGSRQPRRNSAPAFRYEAILPTDT